MRIEQLIKKCWSNTIWEADLYDGKSKRVRRDEIARGITLRIDQANPNRLLTLLGQSIKWQKHMGDLPWQTSDLNETYDIFKGYAKSNHISIKDDEKF